MAAHSGPCLRALQEICPDLDAVFVGSDRMALGVLYEAHQMGLRVPEDLAVMAIDNLPSLLPRESSLDFEVVYIVRDPSYDVYMDRQQALNLALMKELAAMGLQFAFPSRTVYTVQSVTDVVPIPARVPT